jgi:hypothetical protein
MMLFSWADEMLVERARRHRDWEAADPKYIERRLLQDAKDWGDNTK